MLRPPAHNSSSLSLKGTFSNMFTPIGRKDCYTNANTSRRFSPHGGILATSLLLLLLVPLPAVVLSKCSKKLGCTFTRLQVCCYHEGLEDLPGNVPQSIRYVEVLKYNSTDLTRDVFRKPGLFNLVRLHLDETQRLNVQVGAFQELPKLRSLLIRNSGLQSVLPGTFRGVPLLSTLVLSWNEISTLHPRGFEGLTLLEELDLSFNRLTTIHVDAFEGMHRDNQTGEFAILSSLRTRRVVDLSFNNITHIEPGTFRELRSFDIMYLNDNRIASLENNTFKGMAQLKLLDLRRNAIDTISPDAFSNLDALNYLYLRDNFIHFIQRDTFSMLVNLKTLILGNGFKINGSLNLTDVLEEGTFRNLRSLAALWMSENQINSIGPNMFQDLKTLRTLHLDFNNIKVIRSNVFRDFAMLNVLTLSYNPLRTVEVGAFRGLGNLQTLSLSQAKLTFIKQGTFRFLTRLQELDLSGNELKFQPGIIEDLHTLRSFEIDLLEPWNTDLQMSQVLRNSSNLQTLVLRNKIDPADLKFTRHLQTLATLRIQEADMRTLEGDVLEGLPTLKTLILQTSSLHRVKPGVFCPLSELTALDFRNNDIATLEFGVFSGLSKLEELNLQDNSLTRLTEGVFGVQRSDVCCQHAGSSCAPFPGLMSLMHLDLCGNQISYIHPDTFEGNRNLRVLKLCHNHIATLDVVMSGHDTVSLLRHAQCLVNLDVSSNKITTMDASAIRELRQLREMNLADNQLVCDCRLKKTWQVISDLHVVDRATISCLHSELSMEVALSHLDCGMPHPFDVSGSETKDWGFLILQVYLSPVLLGLILLVGAVGNVLLLLMLVGSPEFRSGPNSCILNLAIGDLLSLIINLPISFIESSSRTWALGWVTCKVFMFVRDLTVGVTVYSVVALSVQRFVVTVYSFQLKRGAFFFSERLVLLLVWVLAGLCSVPSLLSAAVLEDRCLNSTPEQGHRYVKVVWTSQLLVYCAVPLCAIAYMYFTTARHLRDSARGFHGERLEETSRLRKRKKVASMVVVLTGVFSVSYVPNFLIRVLVAWSVLDPTSNPVLYASFFSYCLFFCNTCFNPIALYCMSSAFRMQFRRYLFHCRPCAARAKDTIIMKTLSPVHHDC